MELYRYTFRKSCLERDYRNSAGGDVESRMGLVQMEDTRTCMYAKVLDLIENRRLKRKRQIAE